MNVRKVLYFGYHRLMGSSFPAIYEELVREDPLGETKDGTRQLLIELLAHCQRSVPYYAERMKEVGGSFETDPEEYLVHLPIVTKVVIREHFEHLKSIDLGQRKWFTNASSGSTGEPIKLIQDRDYKDRSSALQQFYSTWAGLEIGDLEVYVWGSKRDILGGSRGARIKTSVCNKLLRRTFLNGYFMPTHKIRKFIDLLNKQQPKLIVAYAQAIYELARLAEREKIPIHPQSAIITTAGPLYPFMRETIESVFQCKVFDRYGARELADIAGECRVHSGWHVFPRNCYVEIVDEAGHRVPAGTEGNIVITSLSNFAMPLVRYQLGDRGALAATSSCPCGRKGQVLEKLSGRQNDAFMLRDGTLVFGGYFTHIVYHRNWIEKFQVIQKDYSSMLFKIKRAHHNYGPEELTEIISQTQAVMGKDCRVEFEFVENIPNISSGKYRYVISEVHSQ